MSFPSPFIMDSLDGDQGNGYFLGDENQADLQQLTSDMMAEAFLLVKKAECQEDSFVKRLGTSLLSSMARSIFRRWESTRSSAEQVPDLLDLVKKELCHFADTVSTLQSSVEHTSTEDKEKKSSGSSTTTLISDSTSDLQGSGALLTSKIDTSQHFDLPSTESGTSISSDLDKVGVAQKPELPSTEAEKNITPEESSTPSDYFLTSVKDNPLIGGAQETGAMAKVSEEEEEQRMERTRKVIESLSVRQITRLTRHEITATDVLEILFQLTELRDHLGGWINGSGNRGSDNVDESTLALFLEGLQYARIVAEKNQINLQHLK